jgi:hypothetical protein
VTYHIHEILESDCGCAALLRSLQQDVSLVAVDFCDELRFVQNLQEVIPRYLTKSLRVILPSTEKEQKIKKKKIFFFFLNFLDERKHLEDQDIDGHFMSVIPLPLTAEHVHLL